MPKRRAVLAATLLAPGLARAQAWAPTRPVRFVVPFPAGGATDVVARVLAERMQETLGQPIVVENRAGAAGVIGSEVVARAEPDGHTLLMVVSTHVMNRYHLPSLPYDPIRDFTPVAMLTRNTMVLVAAASQPFDSLRAMIDYAKRNPGRVGTGSTEALSSFIGQELARRATHMVGDARALVADRLIREIERKSFAARFGDGRENANVSAQTRRARGFGDAGDGHHAFDDEHPRPDRREQQQRHDGLSDRTGVEEHGERGKRVVIHFTHSFH
jgi:hypothetical protein